MASSLVGLQFQASPVQKLMSTYRDDRHGTAG
jgi:hypothetical protein